MSTSSRGLQSDRELHKFPISSYPPHPHLYLPRPWKKKKSPDQTYCFCFCLMVTLFFYTRIFHEYLMLDGASVKAIMITVNRLIPEWWQYFISLFFSLNGFKTLSLCFLKWKSVLSVGDRSPFSWCAHRNSREELYVVAKRASLYWTLLCETIMKFRFGKLSSMMCCCCFVVCVKVKFLGKDPAC